MQLVKNAEPASDPKNIDRNLNKDIQYDDFIFIIKKFWCKMEEVRCKMEERKGSAIGDQMSLIAVLWILWTL